MVRRDKVYGHNDATYDIVPKQDQLFNVEFLEIAPTPIIADRVFFAYLRGYLPESNNTLALYDKGLVDATLTVSASVVYPDGRYEDPRSLTIPLITTPAGDLAHLVVRDATGAQTDYLPSSGRGDVLLDFQFPTMWLRSGMWTFKVDARLGDEDNTCLFAMSLTQWLKGGLRD